ncbi:MAG TPA: hypothetical protein VJ570_06905, partial [Holophagaceae bacterium]|nr:hypothetical protein [Holophagaceae bacterium]
LANFRAGNWNTYQQLFGLNGLTAQQAGNFSASEKQLAAFLQADWRPLNSLKLGLGLRWDRQEHPDFPILNYDQLTPTAVTPTNPNGKTAALNQRIPNDAQFSPRFSLTWTPEFDHGKSVLRFNVGRYVSTTPSVFLYQAFTANAVRSASVTFNSTDSATYFIPRGGGDGAPVTGGGAFVPNDPFSFGTSIPAGATVPPANVFTFSPNFKNPYTDRANLGVERAFGDLVLGVSGTYARGKQLERVYDTNLGTPVDNGSGRLVFTPPTAGGSNNRPNTYYRQMAMYVSDAESIYHAYTVSLKYHKEGSALDAQLFYTLAYNKDNDSNERNFSSYSTANTQRLGDEWSWSDTDRRQTLTGYVSFTEPQTKLLTSLAMRYVTGFPYTLTVSGDRNNDGVSGNDRVYIGGVDTGRNTRRSSSILTFDLGLRRDFKLAKAVKLTASMDVFNLLNRFDTYVRPVVAGATDPATTLTDNQALATGVDSGRQVQLGLRVAF